MTKLYETITADNWFKGTGSVYSRDGSSDDNSRKCLTLRALCVYGDYSWTDAVQQAIRVLYPDRPDVPYKFNDHPDTTVEDVIRVCKIADV